MPRLALTFGGLLVILGVGGFLIGGATNEVKTALIPAGFGLLLIICGLLAMKPKLRMHAMHGAALVALLGLGGALSSAIKGLGAGKSATSLAVGSQLIMTVLCMIFLVLSVRSFIAARNARKALAE